MQATVTSLQKINFAPANETEEILQNVRCIIATQKGTVPLDRTFGVDYDGIDLPIQQAQLMFRVAIIDAIQKYEPRAEVKSVEFEEDIDAVADGQLKPIVTLEINTNA